MKPLSGKIAWVSGGGGAVGQAICRDLAAAGARVIISGRTQATLDKALEQVTGDAHTLLLDVGNSDSVRAGMEHIERQWGSVDILVNSAGLNPARRYFHNLSIEDWNATVQANLSGAFYMCKAVLPGMRAKHDGVIVNISSWAGRYAAYFAGSSYAATKRAVLSLTESINMEECINGVRATVIAPGGIDTPLLDKRPTPPSPEIRASLLKPEDVAHITRYVATLPPHVCINEILMSPTLNLPYLGELETPKRPSMGPG